MTDKDKSELESDPRFVSRLMTGYEMMARRMCEMADAAMVRAEKAEAVTQRTLELQVRLQEEREDLISRRHQRQLEVEQAARKAEAFQEMQRDFRAVALLAGKKFLGAPLSGDDSHGLQDLLSSMTAEQIDDVISKGEVKLSEPQRQLLAATLMSLAGKNEGEAA
jgi:hypothetical protein